jgi:L-aspartate oxidase
MWDRVGIVRDGAGLAEASGTLAAWESASPAPNDRASHELCNMLLAGRLMAHAALLREESRGAHYRSDFPVPREEWRRHLTFRRKA